MFLCIHSSLNDSGIVNIKFEPFIVFHQELKEIVPDAVCPIETVQPGKGITKSIGNNTAPTWKDENITRENSSKKLWRCHLTKHLKRDDSKGVAEQNNSLSLKADKSEMEPDSVPRKRGRKPNSLMNPEEGYDHSWICSGRKTQKRARHRKSNDNEINGSSFENPVPKDTSPSMPANMTESSGLQPKIEDIKEGPSPSKNHNRPEGSHPRRGRLKKGRILNKEADLQSDTVPKRDLLSAQIKEKTPQSVDTGSRKEPEETSIMGGKSQDCSKEIAKKGKTLPSHPEEKPLQQSIVKLVTEKINNQMSAPRGTVRSRKSGGESSGSKVVYYLLTYYVLPTFSLFGWPVPI